MILIQTQKETTPQFIQRCIDANQKVECYPINGQPFTITPNIVPGFSKKGPVNRPVLVTNPVDFKAIFGDVDSIGWINDEKIIG